MQRIRYNHQPDRRTFDATLESSRKNRDRHVAWREGAARSREPAAGNVRQLFRPQIADPDGLDVLDAHLLGVQPRGVHLVPLVGPPAPRDKAQAIMAAMALFSSLRIHNTYTHTARGDAAILPSPARNVSPPINDEGVLPLHVARRRSRRDLASYGVTVVTSVTRRAAGSVQRAPGEAHCSANVGGVWLDLERAHSHIDTPMSALAAVLQLHRIGSIQRERILTVLDGDVLITPGVLATLMGSRRRLDEASLLYAGSKCIATASQGDFLLVANFASAFIKERLQQHLFLPDNLTSGERANSIYFDGNALVNAANMSVDDLANDPSVMRLPDFASLTQPARRKMVVQWLDAHGQDTQYTFGTFEHSMASVLKTAALSRGEPAPQPYVSREALGSAFADLTQQWPSQNNTLIDPRIMLGLHLVKTHGIELHGPLTQRLADLRHSMRDLVTEAAGPPVFDRKVAVLDTLAEKTGLSKEQLILPRGHSHKTSSLLDEFMHFTRHLAILELPQFPYYSPSFIIRTPQLDGTSRQFKIDAKALLMEAEARLKTDLPHHPWFAAHARLTLRRENVPLTADAIAERINELVAQYKTSAQRPSVLRHWLDNMPIVSNVIAFVEGIARGDIDEIISSVPVQGNIHNAVEGLITGDSKRTTTALITLVPYVGSGYIIEDGIASNDTAEVVGGAIGLGLDFVTEGEGHLFTRSRVAGHSALGEGRVASHTFSHREVPPVVRLQAHHSLGALRDLGIEDRALMLTGKVGEHGSVGDPYALLAASDDMGPLTLEMQRLVVRLAPVPEHKWPTAMRRSEGGTWQDPGTLAHYARIGPQLYRLAKDDAASTTGYEVWNPLDAYGNARDRTIRLEYRDGQWQEAQDLPGLRGGAPTQRLRVMDIKAAKRLDMPVPEAYATASPDRRPGWNNGPLPVSETQTVGEVRKFLSEQAKDVTRREHFAQGFDQYFDVRAWDPEGESRASAEAQKEIKAFFTRLYDSSETFRSLYNFAVDSSRLGPTHKWTLELDKKGSGEYMSDGEARKMYAPHVDAVVDDPVKFLSKNGKLVGIDSKGALVHEMTHLLTGLKDPIMFLWSDAFKNGHNIKFVRKFGLGERGAVEYFTQRILREADIKVPQRQTYLAITPKINARMEQLHAADYFDLDRYVSLQDEYLDALFPTKSEHGSAGCPVC
jgi:hypothetical protein